MKIECSYDLYQSCLRKQLWVSGYCNGFEHHRSKVQDSVGTVLSTELPTDIKTTITAS